MNVPSECRPLKPFKWVSTRSLLVQIIKNLHWYNWHERTIRQIKHELTYIPYVEYAPAKTGHWFRYRVSLFHAKYTAEFFVRVIEPSDDSF